MIDIQNIKTDPALLQALKDAAQRKMTSEEAFEQKVSWVYGNVSSGYTKDQIREILRQQ